MGKRKHVISLTGLGVIILVVAWLRFESVSGTEVIFPLRADAGRYFVYAYNLRHKHIYSGHHGTLNNLNTHVKPDARRYPGYPFFLAMFANQRPDRTTLNRIVFIQALISSMTLIVSLTLFRTLLPASWSAVALLFIPVCPHLIIMNSFVLSEPLFTFFLVLAAWFMTLFLKNLPPVWFYASAFYSDAPA